MKMTDVVPDRLLLMTRGTAKTSVVVYIEHVITMRFTKRFAKLSVTSFGI